MCSVSSGWIEKIRFGSRLRGREGSSTSCWQQSELSRSWSSIQKRPLDPIIICSDGSYGASSKRTCTFLGASFSSLSNALNCSPSIQGRRRGSLPSQYSVVASRNKRGAKPQRYGERRMMELIISCMSDERLKMTRPAQPVCTRVYLLTIDQNSRGLAGCREGKKEVVSTFAHSI